MKEIPRITIAIEKLPEDGYLAIVHEHAEDGQPIKPEAPIYGNTLIQIRQRIAKRLEKLIVEED